MRVIKPAGYARMPWKNGGGETTEIAVSPSGATLATMDWRISMATVAADGPFSTFPGIDRTLSVLGGALTLEIAGRRVELTTSSAPCRFPGDAPTFGYVAGGPVTDLNVMTRRDAFGHDVQRLSVDTTATFTVPAGTLAVFCQDGALTVTCGTTPGTQARFDLDTQDTLIGPVTEGRVALAARSTPARVFLITIMPR